NIDVLANDGGLFDGGIVVYGDNTIDYTPSNWFIGEDSLKYMVTDIDGDLSIANVYIEIKPLVNNIPVANDDSRGTSKNTDVIVDVLFNDTGLEDGNLNLTIDNNPANGSVVINPDNTITYTPNTDYIGTDMFEYHVCDIDGDCSGTARVTINVKNVNIVPVAVDDAVTTYLETPVTINVLANDTKLFDGIKSLNIYTNPTNGSAVVNPDRTVTYMPNNWYLGTDQFEYWIEDLDGDYSIATVTVTVIEAPNNIPFANDDARGTEVNTEVIVDVLVNDTGLEDGGIIVSSVTSPTNGLITVNIDNTITYTPNTSYIGTDNFDYEVCDGDGDCAIATVTITIKVINNVPVAVDDNVTTTMNTNVNLDVLANDTGLEDGILSVTEYSSPTQGSITINVDNSITYAPNNWYVGSDSYQYMATDVDGDYSIATVNVTIISEPNYFPLANDDSRGTTKNTDVIVDVLVNDTGLENGGLTLTIESGPLNGSAVINVDNTITYTPNTDYLGTDNFDYQVCDIDGDCSTATVTITVKETNYVPVAVDDNASTLMNTAVNVDVLSNDTGLEDGVSSVTEYTSPLHGSIVINADHSITYTPNNWYVGSDSYEYMVSDIDGDYSIARVSITITAVPDYIPVANDDSRGTSINTDIIVDVLVNDTGLEDGGLVLSVTSDPTNGAYVINVDNTITYTPNTDYLGTDSFDYQVCDIDGDCSTATVTITVKETNYVPVAVDDNASTLMNTAVSVDVLSNDTGLEDGVSSVTEYTSPLHGSIVINADHSITYTPNNWYVGSDIYEYMVSDLDGDYAIASVSITITSIPNYVPLANDDSRGTSINTDVTVDVLVNDTGLEDGGIVVTSVTNPINGSVVVNGDNTISYTPDNDYLGTDSFDYQVCDIDGDCSTATVTIAVKESNNVPVAFDDNASTIMNTAVDVDVLSNDTGLEDGVSSVTEYTSPLHGSVVINADHSITYIPNNWYVGSDSYEYMVSDLDGDYSIARVSITITSIPDYIPVANDDARGTSINTDVTVDVLVNDTGLEDGGIVVTSVTNPINGSVVVNGDNTISYTPDNDYLGTDSFDYQVCDIDGDCSIATVTITVKETNYVPLAVDDNASTIMNTAIDVDVLSNDTGLEDGVSSVTEYTSPLHGSVVINADHSITYTPNNWYVGSDSYEYMVSDLDGDYAIARVSITITAVPNYLPVANDDARGTSINTDVTVDVLVND
ncbi:Ig-like domain-containing protein, partial [Bacteroidota bacterium]